ncbi:spindle and kinetochore-associated protein 1 [Cinnamomum micranthum f. kanehirae]|uniref:SKA complex subunit 1 homolog n=1 Tax=Cinnamomum micranthum f. kanehirae TaxID=337451 RepID=A0A443PGF7_9MAGN|nr:spindle and kinetochore-associated protein 1 [Cinnamomum micranthum f. kanehirae]
MEVKEAGTCLDSLVSSFSARIVELQELVIARNMYPATAITDLTAVDTAVKTLEYQMQAIKDRLRQEAAAIPKARKLIDQSLRQQRKLQHMLAHMPSCFLESTGTLNRNPSCAIREPSNHHDIPPLSSKVEESAAPRKEKKGHTSSPRWFITVEDIDSLSSYMRGRLTLEKVNAAINEMAMYADANAQLISAPKKKLSEDTWERALELRDIAMAEPVKGKHFFLDSDMKGSALKLDNTGKAILTILRHLGRVHETRIGHHRVFTLSKPQ